MHTVSCRVTVCFEDPFWVMLCERESGGRYEVSRTVFGAEPRDSEVYAFLLRHWHRLRFSPPLAAELRVPRADNPKRRQREARSAVRQSGVGTKAQQALAAEREQNKQQRRIRTRVAREREQAERYEKHRQKCREKHKGH